jgi:iron-sulfur cluster assembly accessory protein
MIENTNAEPVLKLTERAIIAVKEFMKEPDIKGDGLRIGVRGGGCAGLQYALDFSSAKDNDIVYEQDGLLIFVDPLSAIHLEGTTVDYTIGLSGVGFKFINPLAKMTCGCGNSYAT